MVSKPLVEYFLNQCKYNVIIADKEYSKAKYIARSHSYATALNLDARNNSRLSRVALESDLVVSLLPPKLHFGIAKVCLACQKNLITTSYLPTTINNLSDEVREKGLIFLNEAGEDPGLDHMETTRLVDLIERERGTIESVISLAGGLPASAGINPFSYKFSWRPRGLISAANEKGIYLDRGKTITIAANELFKQKVLYKIDTLGDFEIYPNRDCSKYLPYYGLSNSISFYRGILRYSGWCDTFNKFKALDLFEDRIIKDFSGMTWREFTASLIRVKKKDVLTSLTVFFKISQNHEFIKKISWLGFLRDSIMNIKKGTNADVLIELMKDKLSYHDGEMDRSIIYSEIVYRLTGKKKKIISTMTIDGVAPDNSAMAKAVGLPAAIAGKHIVQGNIKFTGVCIPTLKEIYQPVLRELEKFNIKFKTSCTII